MVQLKYIEQSRLSYMLLNLHTNAELLLINLSNTWRLS